MEVLSPVGSFQKLKYAINYGADAVYLSGKKFSLRSKAQNFTDEELHLAVNFAHKNNVKVYVTLNTYPFNEDIPIIIEYIKFLKELDIDAIIVSDIGIFSLVKELAPKLPTHISTQANVTSWKAAESWYNLGAKRIILAREVSLKEVKEIRNLVPSLELEIFVHGAMCMSYSGRCLLSAFLNDRNANQGLCTHPCRWKYTLHEETRPGMSFPIEEDAYGSYIMNTKDLCLFEELEDIYKSGIDSVKIEGRMKSLYYIANVTRTYKTALKYIKKNKPLPDCLRNELDKVSHREYCKGFFFNNVKDLSTNIDSLNSKSTFYSRNYQFIGEIEKYEDSYIYLNNRAKFCLNDTLEFIFPDFSYDFTYKVDNISTLENEPIEFTKPNTTVKIKLKDITVLPDYGIVRIKLK